jgi:small GTP-binding protein
MFTPDSRNAIPLKFIVVGDCQVGKSCLVRAFSELPFDSVYSATVGVTFTIKQITWEQSTLRIQLWDTAGQEAYRSITHTYYRDANCACVVYDLTQMRTFEAIGSWIDDVRKFCPRNCLIVLVGNKLDLEIRREVTVTRLEAFAAEQGILCFEVSEKTNENVSILFKATIVGALERKRAAMEGEVRALNKADTTRGCCS